MRSLRKRGGWLALLAALALVAAACSSDDTADTTATTADGGTGNTTTTADGGTTDPDPGGAGGTYQTALTADLTTDNYWSYLDTEASAYNGFVLGQSHPALYTLSIPNFLVVPVLASGEPPETVQEGDVWTATIPLREGMRWSDGEAVDANDFVFTGEVAQEFALGSNWLTYWPEQVTGVEAIDDYTVKITFTEDQPGLSIYQNGVAQSPIMPEHHWASVVEEARGSDDPKAALYAASGLGEPSAGTNVFNRWEQGAFASITANPDYYYSGTKYTTYADLSWTQSNGSDVDETYYGAGGGEVLSEYTDGPFVDEIIYSEYGSQDAAYLAFQEGDVDYVFNPSGIPTGRREELRSIEGLEFAINPSEGFRYMAFNLRKAPMSDPAFRQAFAYVIDKEFVTGSVLGGAALPIYSLVPEANAAWYTDEVNKWGFGLTEGERFQAAVQVLTDAGYTWDVTPEQVVDDDGNVVDNAFIDGEGMRQPDGTAVPEIELLTPGPGLDPLRSTFATWIGQWGERLGVPMDVNPTDFNALQDKTFPPQTAESVLEWDLYMLGWGGGDPSLPCTSHQAFFGADQDSVTGGGFNTPGYNDAEFEALSEEFDLATDLTTARSLCADMEKNISENLPYIVLFSTPITDAWRSTVEFPVTDVLGGLNGYPNGWPGQVLVSE
ncbi:MAG: ABC transporter substrate-binding protein [Acidimicrobiales bacterium]|nr:ABC transporter substrate-binding protein [Acidimicrobiales bacterium]